MSLLSDLAAPPQRRSGRPCSFGLWLGTLTEAERDGVWATLGTKSDPEIVDIIYRNTQVRFGVTTIGTHRRGECLSCRS